jgi:hypothetical protein
MLVLLKRETAGTTGKEHDAMSYLSENLRFFTSSAIAAAPANASSVPVLYNPAGSGIFARIVAVRLGIVSGTVVAGCLEYGFAASPSFSGITAGPSAVCDFLGNDASTPLLWYIVATAGAAPTVIGPAGPNAGGALAAGPLYELTDHPDGLVLPPGAAFWPLLSNTSLGLSALVSLDVFQWHQ